MGWMMGLDGGRKRNNWLRISFAGIVRVFGLWINVWWRCGAVVCQRVVFVVANALTAPSRRTPQSLRHTLSKSRIPYSRPQNIVLYVLVFATAFSRNNVIYMVNSFIIAGTALLASVGRGWGREWVRGRSAREEKAGDEAEMRMWRRARKKSAFAMRTLRWPWWSLDWLVWRSDCVKWGNPRLCGTRSAYALRDAAYVFLYPALTSLSLHPIPHRRGSCVAWLPWRCCACSRFCWGQYVLSTERFTRTCTGAQNRLLVPHVCRFQPLTVLQGARGSAEPSHVPVAVLSRARCHDWYERIVSVVCCVGVHSPGLSRRSHAGMTINHPNPLSRNSIRPVITTLCDNTIFAFRLRGGRVGDVSAKSDKQESPGALRRCVPTSSPPILLVIVEHSPAYWLVCAHAYELLVVFASMWMCFCARLYIYRVYRQLLMGRLRLRTHTHSKLRAPKTDWSADK